ncbi:VOC family protein [Nocardia nova]|uniref:VOC family protein n=1 Tax=Nocardia nova TaxID=37330 RepID=UPI0033E30F35
MSKSAATLDGALAPHERLIGLAGQVKTSPLLRLEHAAIRVGDLSEGVDWYTKIVQLGEVGRERDRVYLSCGGEAGFDIALVEGGTGLERLAYSVNDVETLDRIKGRLTAEGIAVTSASSPAPGIATSIRFHFAEAGTDFELVVREQRAPYQVCTEWTDIGVNAPNDLNHVTFGGGNVARFAEMLMTIFDFRLSDIWVPRSTGQLRFAFLRVGESHHDIAMLEGAKLGLHHVAFLMRDVGALVAAADRTSRFGVVGETGIVRHPPGNNMTFYVRDPWLNRVEFAADIALVTDRMAGVQCWDKDEPVELYNLWAPTVPPDSWINEVS